MTPPRPDVSEERRNQILDVAEDVFAKRGFSETRMDDIVAASGLSKGAIYWYFRKKDDLIAGLLARVFRRSVSKIAEAAHADEPASDRLRTIVARVASEYKTLSRLAAIAIEFYALALRNRAVRKFIASMYDEFSKILVDVINDGIARNEFRSDLNVDETVTAFVALFEGLGLVWAIDKSRVRWDSTPQVAGELFLQGIVR